MLVAAAVVVQMTLVLEALEVLVAAVLAQKAQLIRVVTALLDLEEVEEVEATLVPLEAQSLTPRVATAALAL